MCLGTWSPAGGTAWRGCKTYTWEARLVGVSHWKQASASEELPLGAPATMNQAILVWLSWPPY